MIAPAFDRIGVKLFGAVTRDPALVLPERHLGLVQAAETVELGGTYVPLYGLNSALGSIPLLGRVLVGRALDRIGSQQHVRVIEHDLVGQVDLLLPRRRLAAGAPGRAVLGCVDVAGRELLGHARVQPLGQRMQPGQLGHGVDHFVREQPGERGNDPGELRVALPVVLRAVQLVQEKPRGGFVARVGEQVGVGVGKAALLPGLEGLDPGVQSRVGRAAGALGVHGAQLAQQGFGGQFIHDGGPFSLPTLGR